MPAFSPSALAEILHAHLPAAYTGKICVAFSGGVDSTVLLHALAQLRSFHPEWTVRAVHIDHQLQTLSRDWSEQCERTARDLGIPIATEAVLVERDDDQGLEAAARKSRYAVLRRVLRAGEVLVTAHHADDQAETLLLALLRGSGVQGLAAMPTIRAFAHGWHLRPLLSFTRRDLQAWATEQGIKAIDDPSNALLRHDRNYLRHEVMPSLQARWPATAANMGRSASHLGEALGLLEDVASQDLHRCALDAALRIDALRTLSGARRRNVLRYWLRNRGLPLPSTRKLLGLEHDILGSDPARMPHTHWEGASLRWHRGFLYADPSDTIPRDAQQSENSALEWDWRDKLLLPNNLGSLMLVPTLAGGIAAARLPPTVTVRFRRGGEKIRLPGRAHRHALRNLLQENDVLPWWRDSLPLIFVAKQLVAVSDLCSSADYAAAPGEMALQVKWEGAPKWQAVTVSTISDE
jgi:tRNA(Ile)-lysidine synthase